ncbi:MAG: hypothetical protein LBV26_07220 [Bacteroidales bacterium]|jgi:hypothetical protein|nr:hypothetical protein [Bacteroidales bacterium]
MKRLLVLVAALLVWAGTLKSQGELDEQQRIFFRNEKSFGVQLNTNGVGFSYRTAKRTDYLNKNILEFELGTIKHPKEYKLSHLYSTGSSFVLGKMNFPMYLRAGIGKQHELYSKADLGGVSIRFLYSVGPELAVCKPIYYKVLYLITADQTIVSKDEKFNAADPYSQEIYKRASFFKGFDEISVVPGVFAKAAVTFEYSRDDKILHAIEAGANLNAFLKEIPIMAASDNKAIFLSLFVSYRFGFVVNPLDPESNKIKNLFRSRKISS